MVVLGTLTAIGTIAFGYLSRMCGGLPPKLPLGLDQWLYALPYAAVAFLALLGTSGTVVSGFPWWIYLGAVLALAGSFLGKRTGHGQWMDLGSWQGIIKPERLDFIVEWIWGEDPNETQVRNGKYWRDFTGLTVNGFVVGLIPAICLAIGGYYFLALGVLLGATLKGVAYSIGWWFDFVDLGEHLDEPTEFGELLTGIFAGLPLFFAITTLALGLG